MKEAERGRTLGRKGCGWTEREMGGNLEKGGRKWEGRKERAALSPTIKMPKGKLCMSKEERNFPA